MDRLTDAGALDWIAERADDPEAITGFDPSGWERTTWVLHAMYETDGLPAGLTHDDVHRIQRDAGALEPMMVGDVDLEELLRDATVVGTPLGRSGCPGAGWRRLHWRAFADRAGVDPFASEFPPCTRSFPHSSWPVNIQPPAEGSLDREQYLRLLTHLEDASGGPLTECFAYYSPLMWESFDDRVLYRGALGELGDLYELERAHGAPSNIWPADRSWFVYTDADLWATKVSGGRALIEAVESDPGVEAVPLPF